MATQHHSARRRRAISRLFRKSVIESLESRQLFSGSLPGGVLATDTHLTKAQSPWSLGGDVTVQGNVTLTIDAGVTLTGGRLFVSNNGTAGKIIAGAGVTFGEPLFIRQQGTVTFTQDVFTQSVEMDFFAGSSKSSVAGNSFNGGLNVAPEYAASVASGNTFAGKSLSILSTTLGTGESVSLPFTANVTSYSLDGDINIGGGASLTIGTGASVGGGRIFVANDNAGGKLTATGVTFGEPVYVRQTAVVTLKQNTFNNYTEFDLYSGIGSSTVSGNAFNGGLTVALEFAAAVVGNTVPKAAVGLLSENLGNGEKVSLPTIPNATGYSLNGDVNIGGNATLSVADGLQLTGGRIFVANDNAGGKLNATSVTFGEPVYVRQTAVVTLNKDTFSGYTEFDLYSGLGSSTVTGNAFNGGLTAALEFAGAILGNTVPKAAVGLLSENLGGGESVNLPVIPNATGYALNGDVNIGGNSSLTLATGLTLSGGRLFVANDNAGGKLNATGVTFGEPVYVRQTAVVTLTKNVFSGYTEFDLYSGLGSSIVTGNAFNGGVTTALEFANAIAGNSVPAQAVGLLSENLGGGESVTLPVISNSPGYALNGDINIGGNASLTVANGNTLSGGRIFVDNDGQGGKLTALAVKFTEPVYLRSGSTGTLSYDNFTNVNGLNVDVGTHETVAFNSFATTTVSATSNGGSITLANNFWASTTPATIEANRIFDNADNKNLTDIVPASPLNFDPTVPDLIVSGFSVANSSPVAGQTINATFNVKNNNPTIVSIATAVTVTLSGNGKTRTLSVADVSPLNGGQSSGNETVSVTLPAATDAFWGTLPGSFTLTLKADAYNDVVEEFESNNSKSVGITVNKDATAPTVVFAGFTASPSQALSILFSENVTSSLSTADFVVKNSTTSAVVGASNLVLNYDTSTNVAKLTFKTVLAKGTYQLTIAAGAVNDVAGNALAAPFSFTFTV